MSLNKIRAKVANAMLEELLLQKSFFDISVLRAFLRLFNMDLASADETELRPFHCVQWETMGRDGELEFKQHLILRIRAYVGTEVSSAEYTVMQTCLPGRN